MVEQSCLFAAVAGYFGRPQAPGAVGVFRLADPSDGRWQQVLDAPEAHYVMVHPSDPDLVFAGTDDGVYRSADRGRTFTRTVFPDRGQQIWCIHVDVRDPTRMYAGASPVALYVSEDQGASWRLLSRPKITPRCTGPFDNRMMRLAQNPSQPEQLFAALEIAGAIVSHDGGEHWSDCAQMLVTMSEQPHLASRIVTDSDAEGMLDAHAVVVAPSHDPRPMLALRMGLFDSHDDGTRWRDLQVGRFSPYTYARDLRVAPDESSTVYAALSIAAASEDGALFRSEDAGESWHRFDKVQVHGTVMSIGLDAHDPSRICLGARYRGEVFATDDNGDSWSALSIDGPVKDIYCVACG